MGKVWESVWGELSMEGVDKCVGVWGEVRRNVGKDMGCKGR